MIPLLTRQLVRALDRDAIERLGVPGLVLMENAGGGAARWLMEVHRERLAQVLVVGGVGQNGGDAWVLARHLVNAGLAPTCLRVGAREKVQGDARVNLDALEALGVAVGQVASAAALEQYGKEASVIVDGLFGTGLDRPLTGLYHACVAALNGRGRPVFALDLPSGIDADTGQVLGVAVRAQHTATFAAHKRGLHQYPGVAHAGEVRCLSIGVPGPRGDGCALVERSDVGAQLPWRRGDAHKGTAGHVLVIAGAAGKTGAALLSALGAQRAGAGLVTIASDHTTRLALDQKVVEAMTAELDSRDPAASALALAADKAAVVVGPGLGLDAAQRELARRLALELTPCTVLDADALTAVADNLESLRSAAAARVLTPHPGEAARLLGVGSGEVQADRYGAARELAQRGGQVVVLKGARTIVAAPDGRLRVCGYGTPALASGGTGDVLSGLVAALCVELPAFDAAWVAVTLHALAGEQAARADRGLLASEVAHEVPRALARCRETG